MRRGSLVLFGALLLTACQTTYQVERERTYDQDKQAVWDRLLAFLERDQITVTSADFAAGKIAAERRDFAPQGWAECQRRGTRESTGNARMGWPLRVDRDLELAVAVGEQGGRTSVTVDADFAEEQIHPWSYQHFMQPCRSTGALERALFDAL